MVEREGPNRLEERSGSYFEDEKDWGEGTTTGQDFWMKCRVRRIQTAATQERFELQNRGAWGDHSLPGTQIWNPVRGGRDCDVFRGG